MILSSFVLCCLCVLRCGVSLESAIYDVLFGEASGPDGAVLLVLELVGCTITILEIRKGQYYLSRTSGCHGRRPYIWTGIRDVYKR